MVINCEHLNMKKVYHKQLQKWILILIKQEQVKKSFNRKKGERNKSKIKQVKVLCIKKGIKQLKVIILLGETIKSAVKIYFLNLGSNIRKQQRTKILR
ncbi:unnamed protein product [Paramecium octaurelia]|uniref:Uncharacterized protein n=1 Tax=Paramecium octaurelia TaxID=43137 RepID=A0A8S1Y6M3_PAROT|nr:unnamed protein product [Paramecium octaurelia]CAD8209246.1 unnamed protein product [Paramecium octaurelia]